MGVRVRLPPAAPTKVAEKDATPETLAAARVSAVSGGKIEHQPRQRYKRPFLWCVVTRTPEQTTVERKAPVGSPMDNGLPTGAFRFFRQECFS